MGLNQDYNKNHKYYSQFNKNYNSEKHNYLINISLLTVLININRILFGFISYIVDINDYFYKYNNYSVLNLSNTYILKVFKYLNNCSFYYSMLIIFNCCFFLLINNYKLYKKLSMTMNFGISALNIMINCLTVFYVYYFNKSILSIKILNLYVLIDLLLNSFYIISYIRVFKYISLNIKILVQKLIVNLNFPNDENK